MFPFFYQETFIYLYEKYETLIEDEKVVYEKVGYMKKNI